MANSVTRQTYWLRTMGMNQKTATKPTSS